MSRQKHEEFNRFPAHPDENGQIDCLHPKAKRKKINDDEFYHNDFTENEMIELSKLLPKDQKLQYQIHATIRFQKIEHQKCLLGLSPHYIVCVYPQGDVWKPWFKLHFIEIKRMLYGTNYSNIVFFNIKLPTQEWKGKKLKYQIIIVSPNVLKFARLCVRNFDLCFSAAYGLPGQEELDDLYLDVETDRPDLFPHFEPNLSIAQRFQFTYYALCSQEKQPYMHDVVRYFHHQVVTMNGIFNVGMLPFEFNYAMDVNKSELKPVFLALMYIPYMFGIVCSRIVRPDILYAVSYQLCRSKNIRFLYCSNCEATSGLHVLARSIRNNPDSELQYLDLSYNIFTDFPGFFDKLFEGREKPIWYLNFNYCNILTPIVIELFQALTKHEIGWKVKYVHIAGSELLPEAIDSYTNYLKTLTEKKQTSLISLNFNDAITVTADILKPLIDYPTKLKELYIANCKVDPDTYKLLYKFVKITPTLITLDISNTGISAEQLAKIVNKMSTNKGVQQLTLFANHLNLNGEKLISVVKGFLNSDITRWKRIHMDSNKMQVPDIQILTALFNRMPNLRELSLNDNFDASMIGIETELPDILRIRNLEVLHICGGKGRALGTKLFPMLFAIGLSYVLRMYIGGYSAREEIPELEAANSRAASLYDELFRFNVVTNDELGERFKESLIPYIIKFSLEKAQEDLIAAPEGKTEIIKQIRPLLNIIAKNLDVKNDSKQMTHFLGSKVVNFLQYSHNNFESETLNKELEERIESLMNACASACALRELDIRNNQIGNWGIDVVSELINLDSELKSVDIDGAGATTISIIEKFVKQCNESEHLTRQQFPVNDAKRMVKRAKEPVKKITEKELVKQQVKLIRSIDDHRSRAGEIAELPFEVVPELKAIVNDLTNKFGISLKNVTIKDHSGIVEHFGLNLPYLKEDKYGNKLPDNYRIIDIHEQEAYESPSMRKRYIEEDSIVSMPIQSAFFGLHKRQINDGQFDEPSLSVKTEINMHEEEKPEFESPISMRNIIGNIDDLIMRDESDDENEANIITKQLDFDEDSLFDPKDIKLEKIPDIDIDNTDSDDPQFYQGLTGSSDEEEDNTEKRDKNNEKLKNNVQFTLKDEDFQTNFEQFENNIPPPADYLE